MKNNLFYIYAFNRTDCIFKHKNIMNVRYVEFTTEGKIKTKIRINALFEHNPHKRISRHLFFERVRCFSACVTSCESTGRPFLRRTASM